MTPEDRRVRVTATPGVDENVWRVEVSAVDRLGLLARTAGVLAAARLDITAATTQTGPDGVVTGTFWCRSVRRPIPRALADALEATFHQPLARLVVTADRVLFLNDPDVPHTICTIEADDRPGLLAAIAAAFTVAGVDVHRADVSTRRGRAVDRFLVADHMGGRLDNASMGRIRRALSGETDRGGQRLLSR